jgi:hypothetical protein
VNLPNSLPPPAPGCLPAHPGRDAASPAAVAERSTYGGTSPTLTAFAAPAGATEAVVQDSSALIRAKKVPNFVEQQRMRDLHQHLTVEEDMLLIRTLVGSIHRAVHGQSDGDEILKMVAADYRPPMASPNE